MYRELSGLRVLVVHRCVPAALAAEAEFAGASRSRHLLDGPAPSPR